MRMRILFCICFFLFYCSEKNSPKSTKVNGEVFKNVVQLSATFGNNDEYSEEIFLLAKPKSIDVDDDGNVYVLDEDIVKVYTDFGKPIKTISQKGDGPGELKNARKATVSKLGYVTIFSQSKYTFFSPEDKLLGDYYYKREGFIADKKTEDELEFLQIIDMVKLDEKRCLLFLFSAKKMFAGEEDGYKLTYLCEESKRNTELLNFSIDYAYTSFTKKSWGGPGNIMAELPYLGTFLYDIIDQDHIVYINTSKNNPISEMEEYEITILNLNDKTERKIRQPFDPVEFSGKDKVGFVWPWPKEKVREDYRNMLKKVQADIEDRKYYTPLQKIIVDDNFLFAFTYKTNDKDEIYTDVFDINSGKYLNSLYFPLLPDNINDGSAFKLVTQKNDFPKVEVYTIDKEIYRK